MRELLFAFLLALLAGTALAGDGIGTVTHLSGTFSVKRADGTTKVLAVNSDVFDGDLLTTEAETYARIRFADGSEVVLRPATQFRIEKFAFKEDDANADNAFFSLLKGGLRAASGLIGKRSRDLHRVSVRQADKDEIAVLADGPDVLHALELHIVESSQMRIKRGDRLARMAL